METNVNKRMICVLITGLVFHLNSLFAQTTGKYWVQFINKNSPYSFINPTAYLSQKAIQRRAAQGISIDSTDLPVSPNYVQQVLSVGTITKVGVSKWLNGIIIYTPDTNIMAQVRSLPCVSGIKRVFKTAEVGDVKNNKFNEHFLQTERNLSTATTESLNYGGSFNQINMIQGDVLHNLGFKGEGMTIAVLDAGFPNVNTLSVFDSIRTNNQILGGWDFVANNGNFYDDNSHGTLVLSHMAGYVDNQLIGTAPKAKYWLFRSEDAATENIIEEYFWASAAEFADSVGVDIINSSLGYTTFDKQEMNHVYAVDMNGDRNPSTIAADYAASKGILVCVSAGNEGTSQWRYISAPADADSVLTVGAVSANRIITGFSSRGPTADGRIKPTVCAQGGNTTYANTGGAVVSGGNGTSFSSPIIAGTAACLWQSNTSKTNMEILEIIKKSADLYNNPNNDYGYGIPNFSVARALLNGVKMEDIKNENIKIWPVPFSDILNISFFSTDSQTISINIYDISGKLMFEKKEYIYPQSYNQFNYSDLSALSNGMYLINILSNRGVITQKITKF